MNKLISRKFTLAVLALLALSILCGFEKITGDQFINGLTVTVGAFMLANWAEAKLQATP